MHEYAVAILKEGLPESDAASRRHFLHARKHGIAEAGGCDAEMFQQYSSRSPTVRGSKSFSDIQSCRRQHSHYSTLYPCDLCLFSGLCTSFGPAWGHLDHSTGEPHRWRRCEGEPGSDSTERLLAVGARTSEGMCGVCGGGSSTATPCWRYDRLT